MLPLVKRQKKVGRNTAEEKVEVMSTSVTTQHYCVNILLVYMGQTGLKTDTIVS